MVFYSLVFFALMILAFVQLYSKSPLNKKVLLFSSLLVIQIVVGFRVETGNDWHDYLHYYESYGANFVNDYQFEIGFKLYVYLIHLFGFSFQQYIFLHSLTCLLPIYFMVKDKDYSCFFLLLYFSCYYLIIIGDQRNTLSLSLMLLAGDRILTDGKNLFDRKNISLISISILFHYSALISLFGLCLMDLRRRGRLGFSLLSFIACFILLLYFIQGELLLRVGSYLVDDLSSIFNGSINIEWLYTVKLAKLLIFFMFLKYFDNVVMRYYIFMIIYTLLFLIILPFSSMIAFRGLNFYAIFEFLFVLSILIKVFNFGRIRKLPIFIFLLLYIILMGFSTLYKSLNSFSPYDVNLMLPYKSIFYNSDYVRN